MKMNLADIVNGPWCITKEMHREIQGIYDRHLRGETADFAKIEALLGRPLNNEQKRYEVIDGVAVLPMVGVIAKRANMFMQISGGLSTELLARDFDDAMGDPAVSAIVLEADTPGGTVDGTPELAGKIYTSRGTKPILTWSSGMLLSGGIWIGTAADKVLISSGVVTTGSIGVAIETVDTSKRDEKAGVVRKEFYAGKYKRISSTASGPMSKEGEAYLQDTVDYIYSIFIDVVAKYRSVSAEEVLEHMADGKVFHGQQGIDAGLVDGIATFEEALDEARRMVGKNNNSRMNRGGKEVSMNHEELKAQHPGLYQNVVAQVKAEAIAEITGDRIKELLPDVADGMIAKGAAAERARIADVREQSMPGHEDLIAKMELDGVSTGADAAKAIVKAENSLRIKAQDDLDAGNKPVVHAASPEEGQGAAKVMKRAEFETLSPSAKSDFLAGGGEPVN